MSALITIEVTVPAGYDMDDYAMLFGNGGSGNIDYNTALSREQFKLLPRGSGIFGFGHAPWGHFRWGNAHSMRAPGWGHLPWGSFPWGLGSAVVKAKEEVDQCGDYKFAFVCYDKLGNLHQGTPEEITAAVHIAPAKPAGLKKNNYNKTTDVLVLDVAA